MQDTHNFCIINGRKTEDIPGNFTSFQPNGNSVIDYGIASQSLFQHVVSLMLVILVPGYQITAPYTLPWILGRHARKKIAMSNTTSYQLNGTGTMNVLINMRMSLNPMKYLVN